ncbi:MAG: LytTR family DNA-binding domain-containing protein [Lachnospiraceae bacterium]|nr:LytTR family DNA-binding domain-containing protein [Lachnospiraceae bacterium]
MLSIFICEHDAMQRERVEHTVQNHILLADFDMKLVMSTDNPQKILNYLRMHPKTIGLYFLGVNFGQQINGFTLASEIRERDLLGHIVFVTIHSELTLLTFSLKIEALDYIIKRKDYEETKQRITKSIDVAYQRYLATRKESNQHFLVNIGGKVHVFALRDIMFFETSGERNHVILHLVNRKLHFRYLLKDAESYHHSFLRVHNSYVANVENIDYIDKEKMELKMINGEYCRISTRGLAALKKFIKSNK